MPVYQTGMIETNQDSPEKTDDELLSAVVNADEDAFRVLYLRYYERLRQFSFRMTRRAELVDEVLNDTFFTVWKSAHKFASRSAVSTWIFGIAYRKCLKAIERSDRWYLHHPEMNLDDVLSLSNGPEQTTEEQQLRSRVIQGLHGLSAEQRLVFELTHFFGYSYPEIAEVAQCSVNTVKTRMFHARRKLQESLGNDLGKRV